MKSKFEEYFKTRLDKGEYVTSNIGQRALEEGWIACKKEVLKQLKGFEGEYVCDVIDRIKEL